MLDASLSGSAAGSNVARSAIPYGGWIEASKRQQLNASSSSRSGTFVEPKPKRKGPPRWRKKFIEGNKYLDSPDGSDDPNFERVDWESSESEDDINNVQETATARNIEFEDHDLIEHFIAPIGNPDSQLVRPAETGTDALNFDVLVGNHLNHQPATSS